MIRSTVCISLLCLQCLRVETNPLDASGPLGLLLSLAAAPSTARSSFLLFTGTNKVLVTTGNGVYTARTFSGVPAGRIDAAAVKGRTLVGVNSADSAGYLSADGGSTWSASSGIAATAGTKTMKNCGGIFSAGGINGVNVVTASSSDGMNWTQASAGYAAPAVYGAGCHGSTFLLAFTSTAGPLTGNIGWSTDGRNYTAVLAGGTAVPMGLVSDGATIVAVDSGGQTYASVNNGTSYTGPVAAGQSSPWKSFLYANNRILGAFYSAPNCNILHYSAGSWNPIASFSCGSAPTWGGSASDGSTILIAGSNGSNALVYRSTDGGSTWASDVVTEPGVSGVADVVVFPP